LPSPDDRLSAADLAAELGPTSHGSSGLAALAGHLASMDIEPRIEWLAANLLAEPLTHAVAATRVAKGVERFHVLQGDVIRTSSAYHLGARTDEATYIVGTSSCDLIDGRRSIALLLPVTQIRRANIQPGQLETLTVYKPRRHFYLPVLPGDPDDVMCNVAHLDPIHVIANDQVNLCQRIASLSLVGWRIFGVLVREMLIREAEDEDQMRTLAETPK
jgi:hypothetical protein